jgi:hypothetical protein
MQTPASPPASLSPSTPGDKFSPSLQLPLQVLSLGVVSMCINLAYSFSQSYRYTLELISHEHASYFAFHVRNQDYLIRTLDWIICLHHDKGKTQ